MSRPRLHAILEWIHYGVAFVSLFHNEALCRDDSLSVELDIHRAKLQEASTEKEKTHLQINHLREELASEATQKHLTIEEKDLIFLNG